MAHVKRYTIIPPFQQDRKWKAETLLPRAGIHLPANICVDEQTPAVLKVVIAAALSSDLVACRLVLDRVYPAQQAAVLELQGQLDTLREQLGVFQASKKGH